MTGPALARQVPRNQSSRWLVAAALAVVAVIGADAIRSSWQVEPAVVAPPFDTAEIRPGYGPASFADALEASDRKIAGARADLARHPNEWLRMEGLARALDARFRLTASAADLAEADRLLTRALGVVPWPAGPTLTRASVSLQMHDLAGAERALARFDASAVPEPESEQAEARSIRCEIAFQRGELDEARRLCAGEGDIGLYARRANIASKTGRPEEAAALVEELMRTRRLSRLALATLALQRASIALSVGDWEASGKWVRTADTLFPGYWLAEAFVAQQFALEGHRDEARRRLAELADRTGDADVLEALARVENPANRGATLARAGSAWEARSRLLPGTYAAHHGEHLLLNGQPDRGLRMLEADYRERKHRSTLVHYAYALWYTGSAPLSAVVVREGEQRGFMTADMKFLKAVSLASTGQSAEAAEVMAEARKLNPKIDSDRQQLIVFGRD